MGTAKSNSNAANRQLEAKAKVLLDAAKDPSQKTRKITVSDANDVVSLVIKGLNESESCAKLGIKREAWYNWKDRNRAEHDEILTRLKAERISRLLETVDTATTGGTDAAGRPIRSDWRASQWLLSVASPERFAAKPEAQGSLGNGWTVIVNSIAPELAKRAFAEVLDAETVPAALPSGSASQPALPAPTDKPLV
jgi:hypothetical protein